MQEVGPTCHALAVVVLYCSYILCILFLSLFFTDSGAITEIPTRRMTEIDVNIFINVDDFNITKIDIDTTMDIDVESQNTDLEDNIKKVTKPMISGTSTGPTSVVEPTLENEALQENDYTQLIVIVISMGVLIALIGVSVVLLCLIVANKSRRAAKSGTGETYVDTDHIQDPESINIHLSTV